MLKNVSVVLFLLLHSFLLVGADPTPLISEEREKRLQIFRELEIACTPEEWSEAGQKLVSLMAIPGALIASLPAFEASKTHSDLIPLFPNQYAAIFFSLVGNLGNNWDWQKGALESGSRFEVRQCCNYLTIKNLTIAGITLVSCIPTAAFAYQTKSSWVLALAVYLANIAPNLKGSSILLNMIAEMRQSKKADFLPNQKKMIKNLSRLERIILKGDDEICLNPNPMDEESFDNFAVAFSKEHLTGEVDANLVPQSSVRFQVAKETFRWVNLMGNAFFLACGLLPCTKSILPDLPHVSESALWVTAALCLVPSAALGFLLTNETTENCFKQKSRYCTPQFCIDNLATMARWSLFLWSTAPALLILQDRIKDISEFNWCLGQAAIFLAVVQTMTFNDAFWEKMAKQDPIYLQNILNFVREYRRLLEKMEPESFQHLWHKIEGLPVSPYDA